MIWGFVYGAAAMSVSALPLQALFPGCAWTSWWAILSRVVGLALVWFNHYEVFEKVMTALVGLMFVVTVGTADPVTLPNLARRLRRPAARPPRRKARSQHAGPHRRCRRHHHPCGVRLLAATRRAGPPRFHAGDAPRQHASRTPSTGIFVVATLIVGAELLYSANIAIASGDKGLLQPRRHPGVDHVRLAGPASSS